MWFQLALDSFCAPPLAVLVGKDGHLYFRIVDIASLLGKKNGYCFAKRFASDIVLGKNVLPPTRSYPKQTQDARLVLTEVAFRLFNQDHTVLAQKFRWALNSGIARKEGMRKFVDSYKKSPKLVLVDQPTEKTVSVPEWIRQFVEDVQKVRREEFKVWKQKTRRGRANRASRTEEVYVVKEEPGLESGTRLEGAQEPSSSLEGAQASGSSLDVERSRWDGVTAQVPGRSSLDMEGLDGLTAQESRSSLDMELSRAEETRKSLDLERVDGVIAQETSSSLDMELPHLDGLIAQEPGSSLDLERVDGLIAQETMQEVKEESDVEPEPMDTTVSSHAEGRALETGAVSMTLFRCNPEGPWSAVPEIGDVVIVHSFVPEHIWVVETETQEGGRRVHNVVE